MQVLANKTQKDTTRKMLCRDIDDMMAQLSRWYSPEQLFIKVGENNRDLNSQFLKPIADQHGTIFLTANGIEGTMTETYYGGLDPYELRLLSRLHQIAPENVVKPIAEVFMREPGASGLRKMAHVTELVEGMGLMDYRFGLEIGSDARKAGHYIRVSSKAIDVLREFGANGMAHGDAHYGNILVSGSRPIFIDPARKETLRRAQELDQYNIEWYEKEILEIMEKCIRE